MALPLELASSATAILLITLGYASLWLRRDYFPITGRNVGLLLLQGFGSWNGRVAMLARSLLPLALVPENGAVDLLLAAWMAAGVLLQSFCFISRLARHLGRYKLTAAMREYHTTHRQDALLRNWWVRHRDWLTPAAIARVVAADVAVCLLLLGAAGGATGSAGVIKSVGHALTVVHVLLIVVLGCLVWPFPEDGFSIKLELRRLTAWTLLTMVIFVGLVAIPDDWAGAYHPRTLMSDLSEIVIAVICAYLPVLSSLRRQSIADKLHQHGSNLERLLRDPAFAGAFMAFLETEFSSENLLFWQEVVAFETTLRAHSGLAAIRGPPADDGGRGIRNDHTKKHPDLLSQTMTKTTTTDHHDAPGVVGGVVVDLSGPPVRGGDSDRSAVRSEDGGDSSSSSSISPSHARGVTLTDSAWGAGLELSVRTDGRHGELQKLVGQSNRLYDTYVGPDAIQQVNLPAGLYAQIRNCHQSIATAALASSWHPTRPPPSSPSSPSSSTPSPRAGAAGTGDLAVLLQEELQALLLCGGAILKLMTTDSLPRFAKQNHSKRVAWFPENVESTLSQSSPWSPDSTTASIYEAPQG